jgi:hypothetical protein
MNPEIIVAAMLNDPGVNSLVFTRKALSQLPQNTGFPAVVYRIVDAFPEPELAFNSQSQKVKARVQINPLGTTIADVKSIHAAIRQALDFKHHQIFAGKTVISCRFEMLGAMDKDNDAGVWTQSADYILVYKE